MTDWRASLSFFDRFTHVTELQQAIRQADPDNVNDEADQRGQCLEDQIYQSAESKADYESGVMTKVTSLKASEPPRNPTSIADPIPSIESRLSASSSEEKTTLGPYKDSIYHKNGTSSTVYIAHDPLTSNRLLALKVTTPSTQPAPHNSILEVKVLQSISSHENIITLLDTLSHHEHLILTFPFLPFSLDNILLTPSILPHPRKKEILMGLMQGLFFIHANGIIHRDIKPSNILLAHPLSGSPKIIDFGTAYTTLGQEPPEKKCLDVGTTSYRPPELLFGCQNYGSSLDMWAAGCVAAEVLVSAEKRGRTSGEGQERGLFEAGDLGSELQLIKSIFETLGTPKTETWPSSKDCPDWGKMTFKEYPGKKPAEILPGASEDEIDFVMSLVRIESTERMSANEALEHRLLKF